MTHFKSARTVNPKNPLVFSFDVSDSNVEFLVGIHGHFTLEIKPNNSEGSISEIVSSNISNTKTDNETFLGTKIIIEEDESSSGIILDDTIIHDKPNEIYKEDNSLIIEDKNFTEVGKSLSLNDLYNGAEIFFLTDEPKTTDVIISDLGLYERVNQEAYTITPFILETNDEINLLVDVDNNSISFLKLGDEVEKDFSKDVTTIYTEKTFTYTAKHYQVSDKLTAPYRIRFVISNDGRILTISIYDKDKKSWKTLNTFIFNIEKINGEQTLLFSVSKTSAISNITANF